MIEKYDILIVDDESQFIKVILNILKKNETYNLVVATSGKQALDLVQNHSFYLILLDIIMPDMNGFEVCKILKDNSSTKHIPIIFLTARDDKTSIEKGFEVGSVDYITKPFFENEFLARVNTHIKLKIYEEKLKQKIKVQENIVAQQSKMATMGEMIEFIVHQWRQPLSVITTSSSGLKMQQEFGVLTDKILIESCDSITRSANHLSQTIEDFRGFFKKDKVKKNFNIEDIYHRTLKLLLSKFKNRDIEMIENINKVQFNGYENELVQVFMNILNNARDELEKKEYRKLLFVDIYQEHHVATIKIRDNAGGISDDIIDLIFDSYFTTKKDKEGTGIGLYMSKKIITNNFNGSIYVETKTYTYEGEEYTGAEFTISLPVL